MHSTDAILNVENATRRFGGLTAVNQANLTLRRALHRVLVAPHGGGETNALPFARGAV